MGVIYLGKRIDDLENKVSIANATIEDNTADIATNTAAIEENATAIAANAADIDALETAVAKTFVSTGTEITDVNTFLTPGIYSRLTGISNVEHRPSDNAFILEVIRMTTYAYYTLQRWTDCTTGSIYTRVYRASNETWTDWKETQFVTPPTPQTT